MILVSDMFSNFKDFDVLIECHDLLIRLLFERRWRSRNRFGALVHRFCWSDWMKFASSWTMLGRHAGLLTVSTARCPLRTIISIFKCFTHICCFLQFTVCVSKYTSVVCPIIIACKFSEQPMCCRAGFEQMLRTVHVKLNSIFDSPKLEMGHFHHSLPLATGIAIGGAESSNTILGWGGRTVAMDSFRIPYGLSKRSRNGIPLWPQEILVHPVSNTCDNRVLWIYSRESFEIAYVVNMHFLGGDEWLLCLLWNPRWSFLL